MDFLTMVGITPEQEQDLSDEDKILNLFLTELKEIKDRDVFSLFIDFSLLFYENLCHLNIPNWKKTGFANYIQHRIDSKLMKIGIHEAEYLWNEDQRKESLELIHRMDNNKESPMDEETIADNLIKYENEENEPYEDEDMMEEEGITDELLNNEKENAELDDESAEEMKRGGKIKSHLLNPEKAFKIIEDGTIKGHDITPSQYRLLYASLQKDPKLYKKAKEIFSQGGQIESIGNIIIKQFGGLKKLKSTIGAFRFMFYPNGVSFLFKNKKANIASIFLNQKDFFDMKLIKFSHDSSSDVTKVMEVANEKDLFLDQLRPVFEEKTESYFSMKRGGKINKKEGESEFFVAKDYMADYFNDENDTNWIIEEKTPSGQLLQYGDVVFLTKNAAQNIANKLNKGEDPFPESVDYYEKGGTIKEKVLAAKDQLIGLTNHSDLRNWAINNGMDNRSAFPRFKLALKEIGIDYNQMRSGRSQKESEELNQAIHFSVELYVDAKASYGKFGITDKDGDVLWYGKFFDNDEAGEQSAAELSAAKKAVWLASKIKEAINENAIELILYVDAQWLTYQDHYGQKGYVLTLLAKKYNIKLDVKWVKGVDNLADKWTTTSGYKKWSDNDLSSLAQPLKEVETEENEEMKKGGEVISKKKKISKLEKRVEEVKI